MTVTHTFVVIDTEATGLSYDDDRIIEFGVAVFNGRECRFATSFHIQTDVPNKAEHINHISQEDIANGYPPDYAFALIHQILFKFPFNIVAYNAYFDLTMLASEFRRNGISYDFHQLKIVDPLIIHRKFKPFQRAKLTDACQHYGIKWEPTHSAKDDAIAAGAVLGAQFYCHGLRGSFTSLSERCSKWFIEYKGRKSEYWPIASEMAQSLDFIQEEFDWNAPLG